MLDFPRWKKVWLWLVTAAAALAALPSLFALANLPWPAAIPAPLVNLGLDLAGGSHILLEAESGQIAAQLAGVYDYCFRRLITANVRKDPAPAREVVGILRDLGTAWQEIAAQQRQAQSTGGARALPAQAR